LGRPRRRGGDNIKRGVQGGEGGGGGAWTGLIWLRIEIGCGHLKIQYLTFGFHEMQGIS